MHDKSLPEKRFVEVDGLRMAYVEMGTGSPIVFQHGNPTSSYLWRNILPALADRGRCIAVDLVGMGDSDKLPDTGPGRYRYVEHREFLFGAWERLGVTDDVTLVLHDWGSALGFDWASRQPERVRGIAYMEAIVRPVSWDEWPAASRRIFEGFRSEVGERLVLEENRFIENVLPGSVLRELTPAEMDEYRRPFRNPGEDRRPTLSWPREIPLDGEPDDVCAIVKAYSEWLLETPVPKLFINAEPGAILTGRAREFCRGFPNQVEVTVPGLHFIQEDSPAAIAAAMADWLDGL
ncbi:MAG: haloalkane dehalogenase [Woeseiaceae bacterium]|nr:haloalkane dehalogenase [Woeseiaceae bacterium]